MWALQASILTAANQLQRLHDEFDFADTAGAELDVIDQIFSCNLLLDQLLHFAQTFEHTEIEIASIDEGPYRFLI